MLLKSLRLKNFRQYKGEQRIDFSCDPKTNVTIILGNNTFGKTTLLQSFSWCFYRTVNLDNPSELLNYDVMWAMRNGDKEEVLVEIELLHGGLEYTITTHQTYTMERGSVSFSKPRTDVCYIGSDGQTVNVKAIKVDSVIKSILPQDLSDYFFFDTERVEKISDRKDLTDSVKGLLGLTVLENGVKHIGTKSQKKTVSGKLYEQLNQDGDRKAEEALESIQAAQEEIERVAHEKIQCEEEIAQQTAQKKILEDFLRDNETTARLQRRKEELESEIKADGRLAEDNAKSLRQALSGSAVHYFVLPLISRAEELIEDADLSDKGIRDLTRATLEDIIENRETCICGRSLVDHPEAIAHIREEMKYCPPESIGNAVRRYRDELTGFGRSSDDVMTPVRTLWANIAAAKVRMQEADDEIDLLSEKIQGKDNVENKEIELQRVKRRLKDLSAKRDGLLGEEGKLSKVIEQSRKNYEALSSALGKNAETWLLIRYADEIRDWLNETYKTKELETREILEERVNELFEQMYHGRRRVVIDQKYQVRLLTSAGDEERETGESGGLNSVKNFAFIAGLVSLAKGTMANRAKGSDFELISEPYPLVMDAPFSKADEIHTANISRVLPEASEQIVMFVMHKDWQHAEAVLEGRVGAMYELEKFSEQHSRLKEI